MFKYFFNHNFKDFPFNFNCRIITLCMDCSYFNYTFMVIFNCKINSSFIKINSKFIEK